MPVRYGEDVELRHLRYFVGVAEALNFTRAARQLRVAQPALSRQIRQLEAEIGVQLLERNRQGVRLTPAGTTFLIEARAILLHGEKAVAAARESDHAAATHLDVGYVWGLFHTVVPAVIKRFRPQFPEVAVNLFDQTATEQAEALGAGRLDLGFIGFADEADGAGLSKRRIGTCAFVVALPRQHPMSRRRKLSLSLLRNECFIVISERNYPGASRFVQAACHEAGFRPKTLPSAARGHTILGLVAAGCGVALLPEPLQALPHPDVVFRPLAEPVSANLFVAWQPGRLSTAAENLLACLPAET